MQASYEPRDVPEPVPDALAPPPGHPHFALADGARGLAMLSVIVFHAGLDTRGGSHEWSKVVGQLTFGPLVFFVLSAFLLYRPFVAARVAGSPRPAVGGYLRNRGLRILPAYWFFLTAFALTIGLPGDVFGQPAQYYSLTHIYFGSTASGGLGVSWTLCVEVTFYLALPLAVIAADRLARNLGEVEARKIEIFLLAMCLPLSWLYVNAILGDGSTLPTTSEYGWALALPANLAYFAMGMVLARLTVPLPSEVPLRERVKIPWPVFSGGCWAVALLIFMWRMDGTTTPASREILGGPIAFFLMVPVFLATPRDRGVESWLAWRPVRWLGLISYGAYVAHRPVVRELHEHGVGGTSFGGFLTLLAVGGGIALVLGSLSYYLLERPILRFKAGSRRTSHRVVPGAEASGGG